MSLLRFESVLVVAFAGLAGWSSRPARSLARAGAAWASEYAAANLWRRAYYGSWIPNSVAAKEGRAPDARFAQGTTYLRGFFDAENVMACLVVIAAIAVAGRLARTRSPAGPAFAFLVLTAAGSSAFVMWIGGCWMPA